MKKILIMMLLSIVSLTSFAQIINFETTSYTSKQLTSRGWTNWKPQQRSSMLLTIDLSRDVVTIYSPRIQVYRVVDCSDAYIDRDGDTVMELKFIDQDGDRGTMRLLQRRSGKSEVYVCFSNIIWVYTVIRI